MPVNPSFGGAGVPVKCAFLSPNLSADAAGILRKQERAQRLPATALPWRLRPAKDSLEDRSAPAYWKIALLLRTSVGHGLPFRLCRDSLFGIPARFRMNYTLLDTVLSKAKGRPYKIDRRMPLSNLLGSLLRRTFWLTRGFVKTTVFCLRPARVFLGPRVMFRNASGCRFGSNVTVEAGVLLDGLSEFGIRLADNVSIGAYSIIRASSATHIGQGLQIGRNSSCDAYSFFGAGGLIQIGEDVIMGQHVSFHAETHNHADPEIAIRLQGITPLPIHIGDDCWIGANVTFLGGARIGRGSIVGAGSLVRAGDYPPFSVLAGVPARLIRSRIASQTQS